MNLKNLTRLALAGIAAMFTILAAPASATILEFTLDGGYKWYMDSNPATAYAGNSFPDQTFTEIPAFGFYVTDVQGDPGTLPGFTIDYVTDLAFYNLASGGGLELVDAYAPGGPTTVLSLAGPQLYTGSDANPVISLGSFQLFPFGSSPTASQSINLQIEVCRLCAPPGAVPEPSIWLMMILGFGVIGAAMRQRVTRNRRMLLRLDPVAWKMP